MTSFLKSSGPMPPRLGMVVGFSIMGDIEYWVGLVRRSYIACLHKNRALFPKNA